MVPHHESKGQMRRSIGREIYCVDLHKIMAKSLMFRVCIERATAADLLLGKLPDARASVSLGSNATPEPPDMRGLL